MPETLHVILTHLLSGFRLDAYLINALFYTPSNSVIIKKSSTFMHHCAPVTILPNMIPYICVAYIGIKILLPLATPKIIVLDL